MVEKAKKSVAKDTKEKDSGFRKGDFVVYPTHGVGKILGVETQEVSGHSLQLIIIHFEKDRMTLRVPVAKAKNSGLRKLSSRKVMDAALQTLKGRSRVKRAMRAGSAAKSSGITLIATSRPSLLSVAR